MSTPAMPAGYARVTPYLLYSDAAAARDFLVDAFGFAEVESERGTDDDGRITHTALLVVDQMIMIGSPGQDFGGPRDVGSTVHVYVYVDDADAHCLHARGRGAQIQTEPETAPYGERRYSVLDTEGHHWWFATHQPALDEPPPDTR